ncbi:initiation control protein YabA [Streptococcus cuniculipharyngis]|uniref:DUF972 family protein n=1 Tax=Streptococcus cuniculipharyngis TaxID=1562651 RepID=A0A5C5SAC8_9STRE|nr:initiation control protein YabA [Streptococcus cuniculipharyngis]TWS96643.1 DUF972 family protein [Streptococcus cuniculipharyngis]
MVKKELFGIFDGVSQNLMLTLADVEAMKKQAQALAEENARLHLENSKLRERLNQLAKGRHQTSEEVQNTLRKTYEDGFHVCIDLYGQRRDLGECLFCDEQIERKA